MAGFFQTLNDNKGKQTEEFRQMDTAMSQVADKITHVSETLKNFTNSNQLSPFINDIEKLSRLLDNMKNTDLSNINQEITNIMQSINQLTNSLGGMSNFQGVNEIKNALIDTKNILQELSNIRLNNINEFIQFQTTIEQISQSFGNLDTQANKVNQALSNIKFDKLNISDDLKNNILSLNDFAQVAEEKINKINQMKDELVLLDPQKNKTQYELLFSELTSSADNFTKEFSEKFDLSRIILNTINNSQGDVKNLENVMSNIVATMDQMFNNLPIEKTAGQISNLTSMLDTFKQSINQDINTSNFDKVNNSLNEMMSHLLGVKGDFEKIKDVSEASQIADNFKITEQIIQKSAAHMQMFSGAFDTLNIGINSSKSEIIKLYGAVEELNKLSSSGLNIQSNFPELLAQVSKTQEEIKNLQATMDNEGVSFGDGSQNLIKHFERTQQEIKDLLSLKQNTFNNITGAIGSNTDGTFLLSANNVMNSHLDSQLRENYNLQKTIEPLIDVMRNIGDPKLSDNIIKLEESLKSLKTSSEELISQGGDASRTAFAGMINASQDPNDTFGRLMELSLAGKTKSSYEQHMNILEGTAYSVEGAADRVSFELDSNYSHMNSKQKRKTKLAIGNPNEISKEAHELEKMVMAFNSTKGEFANNLKNAIASGDGKYLEEAKRDLESLMDFSETLSQRAINMGSLIKVYDKKEFEQLPKEAQQLIQYIQNTVKNTQESNREIIKLGESFGVGADNVKKINEELDKVESNLDKATGKAQNWVDKFKSGFSDMFLSPLGAIASTAGAIGIGGLGFGRYVSSTGDFYKKQGMMDVDSYRADLGLGADYSYLGAHDRSINKALYYHQISNGLIDFDEYNKGYTNLARQVGGQQGVSGNQAAEDLNVINQDTFALSKVYGISNDTIAKATKVFYQDLRMSAKETGDAINEMAQVARSANIPIDKYVNQITTLADSYRRVGIDGKLANDVMGNLLSFGMNYEAASSLASSMPSAMSSFSKNLSVNGYAGMLSGQFGDMWSGMRAGLDRFDERGNVRSDYGLMMAKNMDAWTGLYDNISGPNNDFKWINLYQMMMSNFGMNEQQASMATNLYVNDKKGFADYMQDFAETGGKNVVVLESQKELENKLISLSSVMSETQKTEALIASSQYQMSTQLQQLAESILPDINKALQTLNQQIYNLTSKLVSIITKITDSPIGQAYGKALANDPYITGGLTLAGFYGAKELSKYGIKQGWKKLTGSGAKATAKGTDDVLKGTANVADDIGKGLANVGDDVLKGAAKGGDDLARLMAKGKKAAPWILGGAALLYGGKKIYDAFNKDDSTDIYNIPEYNTQGYGYSSDKDKLFNKVNDIYGIMLNGGGRSTLSGLSASDYYNTIRSQPLSTQMLQSDFNDRLNSDINKLYTPQFDPNSVNTNNANVAAITGGIIGATAIGAGMADKILLKQFMSSAGSGASKLAMTGAKAAASAGSAVVGDLIYNAGDYIGHHIKGDAVQGDLGKSTASFLTDAGWTATGAAIGSFIPIPVIGTLIGAFGGMIAQNLVESLTSDESGKGIVSKSQNALTKLFTGQTADDIEYKRAVLNNPLESAIQQYQMMGLGREQAENMVEALYKHSDTLKELTSEQKDAWAFLYSEMKNTGMQQKEIIDSLNKTFSNIDLKNEITEAVKDSIVEIGLSQGVDVKGVQDSFDKKGTLTPEQLIQVSKQYDKTLNAELLKQITSYADIGLSNRDLIDKARNNPQEILDIYNNDNHKHNKAVTDWANNYFYDDAKQKTKKLTEKYVEDLQNGKLEPEQIKISKNDQINFEKYSRELEIQARNDLSNFLKNQDVKKYIVQKELASVNKAIENKDSRDPMLEQEKEFLDYISEFLHEDFEKITRERLSKEWDKKPIKIGKKEDWIQKELRSEKLAGERMINHVLESYEGSIYDDIKYGNLSTYNELKSVFGNNKDLSSFGNFINNANKLNIDGFNNINDLDLLNNRMYNYNNYYGYASSDISRYKQDAKNNVVNYSGNKSDAIAEFALANVGLGYKSGSYNWSQGLGEAGFINSVLQDAGVLGHNEQIKLTDILNPNKTDKVRLDNLQVGDVVYKSTEKGTIREAGIYSGNGKVVEMLDSNEAKLKGLASGVRVTDLKDGDWTGGRRFKGSDVVFDPEYKDILKTQEEKLQDIIYGSTEIKDTIDKGVQAIITNMVNNGGTMPGVSSGLYTGTYGITGQYKGEYSDIINAAGKKYNVDPNLIAAMIQQESSFDKNAMSSRGARGLMQLMPDTAKELGLNVNSNWATSYKRENGKTYYKDPTYDTYLDERLDPEKNIMAGTQYLKKLLDRFQDPTLAMAAYNAGATAVSSGEWLKYGETTNYVDKVTGYYNNNVQNAGLNVTAGSAMEMAARNHLGKKYIWGSEGPTDWDGDGESKDGFDCSGLVTYAAHMAGLNVGRVNADTLWKKYCSEISADQLQAGDLGFTFEGSTAKHVGLYTSKGTWIHATSGKGSVVEVDSYSWAKYGRLSGVGNAVSNDSLTQIMSASTSASTGLSSSSTSATSSQDDSLGWGRMLYGIVPSSYSSYFGNDSSAKTNWLGITKDILNQGGTGGLSLGDQQGLARSMRNNLDKYFVKDGQDDPYAETIGSIDTTYTNGAIDFKKDTNVNIDFSGIDLDNRSLNNLISEVKAIATKYGASINEITERVSSTEVAVNNLNDNIGHTNNYVQQILF